MGSSKKGGGGGNRNKTPTVVPHTTSAPMTAAIKKNPVGLPTMNTASMAAPLSFVPGQDGGPAIPKPYEYNVKNAGRDDLAKNMNKRRKREEREAFRRRERASDSGYGGRGYAGGGGR